MTDYVRAVRAPDTTFRACGFRGCTSFASHVLYAGEAALCFVCGQCAAHALHVNNERAGEGAVWRKFRNTMTVHEFAARSMRVLVGDRLKGSGRA